MINKHSKGKEHTRRPLPVRAIAILMAFAMVLSVLYINNRRGQVSRVEAGTASYETFTDSTYIANKLGLPADFGNDYSQAYGFTAQDFTLYVPSTGVTFSNLKSYTPYSVSIIPVYTKESKYYLSKPEGADETAQNASAQLTFRWEDADGTAVSTVKAGEKIYLRGIYADFTLSGTTTAISVEDIAANKKTFLTVDVVAESFGDVVASSTGVTDANISNRPTTQSGNTRYYGIAKLTDTTNSTPAPTSLTDETSKITALAENQKYEAKLTKEIYIDDPTGTGAPATQTIASIETTVTVAKNSALLSSVWYKVGDGEKQTLTAGDDGSYSITSVDPTKKITVGITTDIKLDKTKTTDISVTNASELAQSTDGYDIYWEIAANATTNQGATKSFSVTASDSNYFPEGYTNTKTIAISVGYDSGKPTISGATVDGNAAQKDPSDNDVFYVKSADAQAAVSALVEITGTTNGTVDSATIGSETATVDAGSITGTVTGLTKGANNVIVTATSNYGVVSDNYVVPIFYDPDAPTVTPTITQTGYPVSGKYTCKKPLSISFAAVDGTDGSGVKMISVTKPDNTTESSSTSPFVIDVPASDSNNNQTLTYKYTATDNAGNTSAEGSVSVTFFNELATVEYSVTKGNYLNSDNKTHGIIWAPEDYGASVTSRDFVVEYKITSEVEITSATVNGTAATFTYNSTTGKYDIKFTKSTAISGPDEVYDSEASTPNAWTLVVTNANGHETTHTLKLVQIDVTNPVNNAPTTSNTQDAKAIEGWYQAVVLNISASDVTAGIESITATNVDDTTTKNIFNGEVGTKTWSGNATVNESTGGNPTEGTITVKDRAGNTKESSFSYKVDKTNPVAEITLNGTPTTGTVYLDSIPTVKFVATDDNINDSLTKVYVGDDTTGISVAEANAKTDFADLVGETPQQNKEYKFKLEVYDKSGRVTTTDLTVVLDSVAPVATITVLTPAERTTGYYNKNNEYVELKLEVKDTNVKTVTVIDETEGNTIDITPATDAWTKTSDGWSTTIKVTSEGTHKISMKADDMSNLTDEADPCTIHIDRTDPEVTTLLNDVAYTAMSSYQVTPVTTGVSVKDTYEDTTNGVSVKITREKPDGGTATETKTGKGSFTLTNDGIYTVEYTVTDLAGNSVTKTIGFTLDSSAPVHNIYVTTGAAKSSKYSNEYSNKVGKFENEEYTYGKYFNTDVFLDVAYFDYNMASVTVYDNDVPVDVTWSKDGAYGRGTIAISSEGYHEIKMSSEDLSGNKVTDSGSSAVYFTIDKTAPVLTTYLDGEAYADTTAHREKAIAQVGVADDNPDEDDISITVERQPNSGDKETTIYYGLNGLEYTLDGYYTVTYNVSDKAGNPANISCGFTIDNTSPVHNMYVLTDNPAKFSSYKNNYNNPVGVFASRPSQESYEYGQYYGSDVSVELNVYDYNLDWVYVTDNGAEISPSWTWDGPYGKAVVTLSSEGYHELKMWSKDLSGNETEDTEVGQKVRLYVDKTSPSITTYVNSSLYTEGSGVRYLNTNASVSVSVNDANKDSTDLVRTSKMTPPGGSSSSQTDNIGETTENYSTEADYEVTYVATDLAGNKSATRNVQFRVDKTPPQLSITGDGTSTAKSVAVSFGIKEAFYWDMTSSKYSIYKKAEGTAEALEKTVDFTPRSANDSQSYTLTDDAEYRFEFSAEDKCGNKTEMKGTLIKDGTAPVIMLSGVSNYDKTDKNVTLNISVDEAFYSSNKVTLTGTRTDINGKKTNIDFNQFVTNRSKISNLEQLFEEDGIYDITVTSTDKAGNTSSKSLHFTIDTTDPEIGDLSKYDGVKTNKFEWDIDLDDLVKDLTVCDITVYMDGSLYDGTSDIADGSHVLRVEAVDELGHKSFKEVTFVLDTKGPNIIISNVEDGDRLLESTDVTVTVEIDEDILDTVSLNDKAVTVTDNKATFTVNAKGKYRINATAHDEAGNTSSTEIEFSFGKQMNIKLIAIIAGAAILLLAILLVIIKRRRDNAY